MKKKFLYVLIIAFVGLVLSACSKPGGDDPKKPVSTGNNNQVEKSDNDNKEVNDSTTLDLVPEEGAELVIWGPGDDEAEWANYVMEKFSEEYGIPTTYEEVGHTDAPGKLETDGPAGLGGDVFMAPHDHVGNMNTAGLIYENYFAEEYSERFMEAAFHAVSAVSDDDQLVTYGFPLAIETVALYYNKDLLEEMNFEPAETMDELIEQSKQFMEANPGSYGFMFEPGNFYYTHAFFGGYGGYIFGEDNTNPDDLGLNSEEAVKAGELMIRIRDEILPLKKEDITGDIIGAYFDEGKLLYNMTGPWSLGGHLAAGVNVGITTMPKLENGNIPTTFSGVKALFVNSYSKYPRAATLFAKFASSDEMLLKRYEMTNELPPSNALLDSKEIKENEYTIAFLKQADYSISMPNIPEMESVWGGMEVSYTAIWNGDEEPQVALDKGTQQILDALEARKN